MIIRLGWASQYYLQVDGGGPCGRITPIGQLATEVLIMRRYLWVKQCRVGVYFRREFLSRNF
ncbi:hypothetical protein GCM10009566_22520 [Streptomyces murinus]